MTPLPWLTLDALQAGGLLALAVAFGADGLHRRDRMMGWLGLACLLISLRHGAGIFDGTAILSADSAGRLRSLMASLGYLAMIQALVIMFPDYYPRRVVRWMALGMAPNVLRCLFLPLNSLPAQIIHGLALLIYFAGFGLTLLALLRARKAEDPFGLRLLGGLLVTMLPILVELVLQVGFGYQLRISGIGIMLMAISLAASWFWVLTYDLQRRMRTVEAEAAAWRSLIPGFTWRSGEDSPLMAGLFGPQWIQRMEDRMLGSDGISYRLHRAAAPTGGSLGWLEARRESDSRAFLQGWTVALGMEEGEEFQRIQGWLQSWGAHVEPWGMVPPREGPFPSLLLWFREPSILAVWREGDLARRRCRWVQFGGSSVDGPHIRMDASVQEDSLRRTLQQLMVVHR